jgi:putative ABC transport system permease protein
MSWVISAIACLIGALGVLNTMAMSVFERRAEIGSLRAMGWRTSRVIRLILSESLLLAAAGASVGIVFGLLVVAVLSHWHVTSGLVQGDVSLRAIGEGVLTAAAMAVAGAAYPAFRIARTPPVESLRAAQ